MIELELAAVRSDVLSNEAIDPITRQRNYITAASIDVASAEATYPSQVEIDRRGLATTGAPELAYSFVKIVRL